jgi:hypothetical protein
VRFYCNKCVGTIGRRNRGRPRKRWIEDIEEDIQITGIRGWRKGGMEENY